MVKKKILYINKQLLKLLYSTKNNKYFHKNQNKLKAGTAKSRKFIIHDKSLHIQSFIVNNKIYIYKGKLFRELLVPNFSIGFKLGEFVMTKKPFHFAQKQKKKK